MILPIKNFVKENVDGSREYLERKLESYQRMLGSRIINPWELLDFLDIELYCGDLQNFKVRGFFKIDERNTPQICCDQSLNNPKLRYTIMHEVAHKLLLDYISEYFLSNIEKEATKNLVYDQVSDANIQLTSDDVIERLCDDFAIEALMPDEILQQFMIKHGKHATNRRIAEYFGIEEELVKNYLLNKGD